MTTSTAEPGRFADGPLASTSGQFPLGSSQRTVSGEGESPSGPVTRPFGLRQLREMSERKTDWYRYCHRRQMAITADGRPMIEHMKLDWTTVTNNDGDEGPSEDYEWENVKDCAP